MLQYSLVENMLTAAPDDLMAVPLNVHTYSLAEVARRILARHPGMGLSQINAVIEEFIEEVCIIVEDGGALNTPLFNAHPSIAGVFGGAADSYDPERHRARINLQPGVRMRNAAARMKMQKEQAPDPRPFIVEVLDVVSGTVNQQLTPGGVVQLKGGRLKLVASNPDNGIFLISGSGAIKLDTIVENKPSRLIAMLPANLPQGAYTVEVRTTLTSSNKESRSMKTGWFDRQLTV
ncbi:MAG: DUF4469 domain-containing protein [Bacteroidales bacterium]|jgi:hypothetical protein|nr:DUF4469 domain-containing protein [Bacteroidales bacterium]